MKLKSFRLETDKGRWLGTIIISDTCIYTSVTDYGNLSFGWDGANGDFREFLISLDPNYFAGKMYIGINYIASGHKVDAACELYAEKILPALKEALKKDLIDNPIWE